MTRPAPIPDLAGRSVLTLRHHSAEAITAVLDLSHQLRATPWTSWPDWLPKRTVGLIFERPSTRTRVAFETGIGRLGGQSIHLSARDMQLGRGEALEDTALILSGMLDAVVLRTGPHEKIVDLARFASIPVINALTYEHHPCQGLADLMTLQEVFGDVRGLPVAYVGDGNNCCISLVVVGAKLGLDVTCACPEGFEPNPEIIAWANETSGALGGGVRVVREAAEAAEGVRAIYTDTWVSMGDEEKEAERIRTFTPYRVDAALMGRAASDAIAMHPLPAHHEEEITYEVLHGRQSVAWQQGHNRLYTQAALMAHVLAESPK